MVGLRIACVVPVLGELAVDCTKKLGLQDYLRI